MAAWILIVDDEPKLREMMTIFLENEGYRVSACPDGPSAIEAVRVRVPDLILLDVRLRDMDGWEVHDTLRASDRTKDVHIIILTAKADETLAGHENGKEKGKGADKGSKGLGPTQLMYKPFSPDVLLDKVRATLHR